MICRLTVLLGGVLVAGALPAMAANDEENLGMTAIPIGWQHGPCTGALGTSAAIKLPAGYAFADGDATRKLMEMMHNPSSNDEVGLVAPKVGDWFVVFEFSDVGYVKDDDKSALDADALFKSLKTGNAAGNKERQRRGWKRLELVGWQVKPHYDEQTHNLEWATQHREEGETEIGVNYNTRLLGRHGVMRVTLVAESEELAAITPAFKSLLREFSFTSGNTYAEWRPGDKVATYGLAALITGGAAAVAIKSGFLPKLIKVVIAGGIAVVAAVGAVFRRILGRRDSTVMTRDQ